MTTLRNIPHFDTVPAAELELLEEILQLENHPAGETLFQEGDPATAFYIIIEGTVLIIREEWGGKTLDSLGPGEFFGEMGVAEGRPRSATARTKTPVTLLSVTAEDFCHLVARSPSLAMRIMATIGRRNRQNASLEQFAWTTGSSEAQLGSILLVCSMTGGSGVSTAVCNLGFELARQTAREVCVVDGSIEFGDLALMLDVVPHETLATLAQAPRLTADAVQHARIKTTFGFDLLAAPLNPDHGVLLTSQFFRELLGLLRERYAWVVVDSCHDLREPFPAILREADYLLYVMSPYLHALKNLRLWLAALAAHHLVDRPMRVVINRFGDAGQPFALETFEKHLGFPAFGTIPPDLQACAEAIDAGRLLCKEEPAHPISQAYATLAAHLLHPGEELHPELPQRRPRWLDRFYGPTGPIPGQVAK